MHFDREAMGPNVSLICKDESCTVYQVNEDSGEGVMTAYDVFPGVYLLYNDFHMEKCFSEFKPDVDLFCIDHCREGRIEWEIVKNKFIYLEAGDLQMNNRKHHVCDFSFPLKHYHGITVGFYMEKAMKVLPHVLERFPVDLAKIREKFCGDEHPFVMRAGAGVEHIFSELYTVPEHLRMSYFKIKVLELLLFLDALEVAQKSAERPYFYKTQVEKVKAIVRLLTDNLERHYTLKELSERFEFPLTSMKLCFKGVYGTSIYAYMKEYRMNAAALMLQKTNENVVSIANRVGYENPSKFAAAFQSVMGMCPAEYRKSVVRMDQYWQERSRQEAQ